MNRFRFRLFLFKYRKLLITLIVLLFILLSFSAYIAYGAMRLEKNIKLLKVDVEKIKTAQSAKSLTGIIQGVNMLGVDLNTTSEDIKYFKVLSFIPYVNGYYFNATDIVSAAINIDNATGKIAASAEPLSSALGYGPNPVLGPAKVQAIVAGLPLITTAITNNQTSLSNAENELNDVNQAYLPNITYKGINIKTDFNTYKNIYGNFVTLIPKLNSIVPVIQTAMGASGNTQNYLLLLENDKELRPTGGFITSYGYLTFTNGALGKISTNDIYSLDKLEQPYLNAPVQLKQYVEVSNWYLRDSNYSPDVPTSAKVAEEMYRSIPSGEVPPINGVVYLNTQFVTSLLNATGPVYVPQYNVTVNANNAAYLIEYYSEKVDNINNSTNRKKFINYLIEEIKSKVFAARGNQLISLIQLGLKGVQERNVSMYADNPSVENLLVEYNLGGVFPTITNGTDFLGFIDTNVLGNKSDFYIQRSINDNITHTSKGWLETVAITFTNPQVYDGWLNISSKKWIRLYVPLGSKLVSFSGDDKYFAGQTERVYNELGYTVFDTHITVPVKYYVSAPATHLTLTISYYLPSTVNTSNYKLYIYKQGGIPNINTTVDFNGKTQSQNIYQDTELNF